MPDPLHPCGRHRFCVDDRVTPEHCFRIEVQLPRNLALRPTLVMESLDQFPGVTRNHPAFPSSCFWGKLGTRWLIGLPGRAITIISRPRSIAKNLATGDHERGHPPAFSTFPPSSPWRSSHPHPTARVHPCGGSAAPPQPLLRGAPAGAATPHEVRCQVRLPEGYAGRDTPRTATCFLIDPPGVGTYDSEFLPRACRKTNPQ
jgi:hypothetical protein